MYDYRLTKWSNQFWFICQVRCNSRKKAVYWVCDYMVCISTNHHTAKERIQLSSLLHTLTQSLVYCIHSNPCFCLTQLAPTYKHAQYVSVITKLSAITKFAWQSSNPAVISQNKNFKRRHHCVKFNQCGLLFPPNNMD